MISPEVERRNKRILVAASLLVCGMIGLSFAAVPLYDLFCRVTGYGGTPRIATEGGNPVIDRTMTVRFNADVAPGLPWDFQPEQRQVEVRVGEDGLAFYRAVNHADRPVTGRAVFNVTPLKAGPYFAKVACFCFDLQTLQPGEAADMPVSFFIDPAIVEDDDLDEVRTITLSYTFFQATEDRDTPEKSAAVRAGEGTGEPIN